MATLTDGQASAALRDLVGELSRYLDDVSADLFGKLTDADVLAELQQFEVLRRRLAVVDPALVAEVGRRGLADWCWGLPQSCYKQRCGSPRMRRRNGSARRSCAVLGGR